MNQTEHQLQVICIKYFRIQYPNLQSNLFAIPNGGKRDVRVAMKLKSEGVLPGVPDLFLALPNKYYHGLFIEMKVGYNKLTPAQLEMKFLLIKSSYSFAEVRSIDEFIDCINHYLN